MPLTPVTDRPDLPLRPADGHKGTFGTVIVVGGSPLMVGAPALCATAALRSGAGLVKIAGDPAWLPHVIAIQPSATAMDRADLETLEPRDQTVLAIGPGLAGSDDTVDRVHRLLAKNHPIVLDADGLNAVAQRGQFDRPADHQTVLTPHPGEYRRLAEALNLGDQDPVNRKRRPAAAQALAQATNAVVVLKGQHTVVTDGQRIYTNGTGNPALATAGTGDVLTGLIAGLIAQGTSPFDAAVLGVWAHGRTADLWAMDHGPRGLLAIELANALPRALSE